MLRRKFFKIFKFVNLDEKKKDSIAFACCIRIQFVKLAKMRKQVPPNVFIKERDHRNEIRSSTK